MSVFRAEGTSTTQLVARQQGDHVEVEDDGVAQGDEVQGVAHEGTADAGENEGPSGPPRCCCCGHS